MTDAIARINSALGDRYTIEREIGEGGMATVYLAADLRHDRQVALKVLKPELAAVVGADRFLAEIKTTAKLQHPNILPLHDSGEAGSFLFYVMPFVEGESLRDQLDREHQLPVEDAVEIARSLAEALEYAHEKGVVHRDIKPANVLIQAGKPIIADFGIALAVGAAGGGRLTETGLSVGTPHYMSPEQATGEPSVGGATDVYALSCVLYEMLVGEPPYTGSSAQAVLGKIIAGDLTEATRMRPAVPAHVDAALRKGLERLPADRFRGAGEFARALGDPGFRYGEGAAVGVSPGASIWKAAAVVLAVSTVGLGGVAYWALQRPAAPEPVERFETPFRSHQVPGPTGNAAFALSPDGAALVFRMGDEADQLWVRKWDDPEAFPIRGTEDGGNPVVSPDGERLAFGNYDGIMVVSMAGGPVTRIGEGLAPAWGDDGFLYWSDGSAVVRAPAAGGVVETVAEPPGGESYFPNDVLPGSDGVLVTTGSDVAAISTGTGEVVVLAEGYRAQYTESGHLLYLSSNTLMAARFDPASLTLLGPVVAIMDGVQAFSVSDTGKLYYSRVGGLDSRTEFVWVTREGQATPVDPGWTFDSGGTNPGWSLSPDGTRLAYRNTVGSNDDVWIKELPDGPNQRLTTSANPDQSPRWSADGAHIIYGSGPEGDCCDLWTRRADGTGEAELLFDDPIEIVDGAWSPDQQWLVMRIYPRGARGRDIIAVRPGIDTVSLPLLTQAYDEKQPALSPDGRWLAYVSTESGQEEVFVRPFPDVDSGKWQVSTDGGVMPVWANSGEELFFVDDAGGMVAARVDSDPDFVIGDRQILFSAAEYMVSASNILVAVTDDDGAFLMARRAGGGDSLARFVLINNFAAVLKERVPE